MDSFNEKFENVEQALKYIADSQAKSEWLRKKSELESRARFDEIEKHLAHITKLTGIVFDDLHFQSNKLKEAGEILSGDTKKA